MQESIATTSGENYRAYIGSKMETSFSNFWNEVAGQRQCYLVIDEEVERLHGDSIKSMLIDEAEVQIIGTHLVPSGESSKSWDHYRNLVDNALNAGILRSTPLVAVGGGVTGDLGGFAASSIMRGVPLIHLPTTLLAMVDSSIGGKTGINHSRGKNLVGSFYQPIGVWIDTQWLHTLNRRDWVNGFSEILKYGFIENPELFYQVQKMNLDEIMTNPSQLQEIIRQSIRIKANIVKQDTQEKGLRAVLNLGHTFGHALEAFGDYGDLGHGEAVYAGMVAAVEASNICGAEIDSQKLLSFKDWYNLRLNKYSNHIDELIELMKQDKKSTEDGIRLVLLQDWGKPYVSITNEQIIRTSFKQMFAHLA